MLLALAAPAMAACGGGPALRFFTLGPATWLMQAADGDAEAGNRGVVSHALAHRDAGRLWLIGSGPTPVAGQALACGVQALAGQAVTDLVNAWPRPEAVMGNVAFAAAPGLRLWGHEDVADSMARQCAHCSERLRARLGAAAGDLGAAEVWLPQQRFKGDQGELGPWAWWRLWRAPQVPVTVFHLRGQALWFAPGLLWRDGAPDLRDSSLRAMAQATQALLAVAQAQPQAGRRWWGEQGGEMTDADLQAHARYWQALDIALQAAQARGDSELEVPQTLPGVPAWMTQGERHRLNWQRGWREVEAR